VLLHEHPPKTRLAMHAGHSLKHMDGIIKSRWFLVAVHIPHLCTLPSKVYERLALRDSCL